jgi:hypothetical protein
MYQSAAQPAQSLILTCLRVVPPLHADRAAVAQGCSQPAIQGACAGLCDTMVRSGVRGMGHPPGSRLLQGRYPLCWQGQAGGCHIHRPP